MRLRICALLPLLTLALVAPAEAKPSRAAQQESARKLKEAEQLYAQGRYLDSAAALEIAQRLSPHPRILYNLARAYDQGGELDKALATYQQYVTSKGGTDLTLLKRSALAIDRLRGLIAQREETARKEAEARAKLDQERAEAEARAKAEAEANERAKLQAAATLEREVEAERLSRARARIGAYSLGGLALAGVGTGIAFGLQASASRDSFSRASTVAEKDELERRTRGQALIADVGFGVSIASALAAALLYPKGDEPSVEGRIELADSPGGAGVKLWF